jgi:hypothetical protein
MRPLFCFAVLISLLSLPYDVYPQPLDRESVLQKLIESYGGETNLRKLERMVQEWDMVAMMGNRHGKDVRSIRVPDQLKVELTYPDKTEIRILNGEKARVAFNNDPWRAASAPQQDAMRLQLMRLYSPLVLRDKGDSLKLMLDGEYCALSLVERGIRADYLVNQDTWRIEKVVGTLWINDTEMRFLTEYSDFKFVDGTLVHQRENKFAANVNTAVLQLRNIEFNADLDDSSFTP